MANRPPDPAARAAPQEGDLRRLVGMRVRRISALEFGLATGAVAGLALFAGTNWLVLKGGPVVGPHLGLLGQFFIGYEVTFLGSLIGFAWAAAWGFALAWTGGCVYNFVADRREGKRRG
jgi:hypothetical protein